VAENAKSARALLKRVDAVAPLARPLQDSEIRELPRPRKGSGGGAGDPVLGPDWLAPALDGQDMGLVSEAGLPAVADPGAALVRAAHMAGVPVRPLSGPSSLMLALAASGLNGQSFAFVGYLPTAAGERTQRLRELEGHSRRWQQTQIVIETPYRNCALLSGLRESLQPDTLLSVACGITLPGEAIWTEQVQAWRHSANRPAQGPASGARCPPVELPSDVPAVFMFLAR
jgi:16S rRNA (cytidine1402-2'-O)-methyltransferase